MNDEPKPEGEPVAEAPAPQAEAKPEALPSAEPQPVAGAGHTMESVTAALAPKPAPSHKGD